MTITPVRRWALIGAGGVVLSATVAIVAYAKMAQLPHCWKQCASSPNFLLAQIRLGENEENFVSQAMQPFRSADRAGDGLDKDDIAIIRKRSEAQRRAQKFQMILSYDLDGDLRVTRKEIDESSPSQGGVSTYASLQADRLMEQFDLNHDGVIVLQEIASVPDPNINRFGDYRADQLEQMIKLGHGGRLLAPDLQRAAQKAFESVDKNHDGSISPEEYQEMKSSISPTFP